MFACVLFGALMCLSFTVVVVHSGFILWFALILFVMLGVLG